MIGEAEARMWRVVGMRMTMTTLLTAPAGQRQPHFCQTALPAAAGGIHLHACITQCIKHPCKNGVFDTWRS